MVPHVAARKTHQRLSKFSFVTPKRLLQQYLPTTDIRLSTSAQIWIGWLGRSIQLAQGRSIAAAVWRTIRLPLSRIEVNDAGRADKFCPTSNRRFAPEVDPLRSPGKNGAGTQPSAGGGTDEIYCCPGSNCVGARACALACVGGIVDTGLRVGVAIGGGGAADVLRRRFCSEALAIARAICSWLALSCSAVLAFSRANSSWLVLSCSIPCCTFARSRAIVWSNCVSSGGIGAAAGC